MRNRSGEVCRLLVGRRHVLFLIWFQLLLYTFHSDTFLPLYKILTWKNSFELCVKTGKDCRSLTNSQFHKRFLKMRYSPSRLRSGSQAVLTYPLASIMFGELWLPAQEFPWKWIQGFSTLSPLKGIHQTAPEQNARHGVSCIAIKKNDTPGKCTMGFFITENKYAGIEESLLKEYSWKGKVRHLSCYAFRPSLCLA